MTRGVKPGARLRPRFEDDPGYICPGAILLAELGTAFVPYIWRDPARMTPGRLAELREWDRIAGDLDEWSRRRAGTRAARAARRAQIAAMSPERRNEMMQTARAAKVLTPAQVGERISAARRRAPRKARSDAIRRGWETRRAKLSQLSP